MTKVTISSSDSWMSQNHRGSGNEPQKPADPWLYMGNGMYMKYTQFIERRKNKNAS
jgi:hypothetical protein